MVKHSLRWVGEHPQAQPALFNSLLALNLRVILSAVVAYLEQAGIYYTPRIDDIGLDHNGSLKVYIPPNVVFDSQFDPSAARAVQTIAEWWEAVQVKNSPFRKDKKTSLLQHPRLSSNAELEGRGGACQDLERELGELLGEGVAESREGKGKTTPKVGELCIDQM